MKIGMVGLGRMGGNMAERLRRKGHEVVGFDRNPDIADVKTLTELARALDAPPHGPRAGAATALAHRRPDAHEGGEAAVAEIRAGQVAPGAAPRQNEPEDAHHPTLRREV